MQVICSMVILLDGFIADSDGLTVSGPNDWERFEAAAKKYKNFVIGRGTNRNGGLDNIDCEHKVMCHLIRMIKPVLCMPPPPKKRCAY